MKRVLILLAALFISGCSAIDITAYRDNEPNLDLFDYFEGETRGWGIVQDRKGRLLRHFIVDIEGRVSDQGQLVLHEEFSWNDGEESTRTWVLDRQSLHSYSGTAGDVVGNASGSSYGNVVSWKYQLNLKIDDSTWKITFDDWMFLVSDQVLINRANMSKFGFKVGEVTIAFHKAANHGGQ